MQVEEFPIFGARRSKTSSGVCRRQTRGVLAWVIQIAKTGRFIKEEAMALCLGVAGSWVGARDQDRGQGWH